MIIYCSTKFFLSILNKTLLCLFIVSFTATFIINGQDCIEGYAEIKPDTLNGIYGFTLNGIDNSDNSGTAVSSAGDVNNDGFDDLIIGAYRTDNFEGEAYIVYGDGTNMVNPFNLNTLDGINGFIIQATGAFDYESLGNAVSTAGDFNNDGFDDLIVGAYETAYMFEYGVGAVYLIYGQNNINSPFDLTTLNGSNGFVIYGLEDYNLGVSVSTAGDFNNDGFDDVIIGTPYAETNGNDNVGLSYIIFGSTNFTSPFDLSTINGNNGFLVEGLDTSDNFGLSVSSAGDINNDGFDDVIIGSKGADPNGISFAGECYVIFGSTNVSNPFNLNTLNGNNGFVINGINVSDGVGQSVSSAGDINNDGFDDIIVGGIYHDECYVIYGGNNMASSFELSNLNGNNGFVIIGLPDDGGFGNSISDAGDVNNDGFDDIIVGSFFATADGIYHAGKSYVIYGGINIINPFNVSDLNGNNAFVIYGIDETDNSGNSVHSAGDMNNDGFDDIIVGAPNGDPNGIENAGESYVIYGNCGCNIEANILNLPASTLSLTPINLAANPPGGQFSGNGIIFNAFNPVIAGAGVHTITYEYTAPNGCQATTSSSIFVVSLSFNFVNNGLGTIAP